MTSFKTLGLNLLWMKYEFEVFREDAWEKLHALQERIVKTIETKFDFSDDARFEFSYNSEHLPSDSLWWKLHDNLYSFNGYKLLFVVDGYWTDDAFIGHNPRFNQGFFNLFFEEEERQQIYTFIVNCLIHAKDDYDQGYDTLYDAIINDENSLFYGSVPDSFLPEVHNMRFWENIDYYFRDPECVVPTIEQIIDMDVLDPVFLPNGIAVLRGDCESFRLDLEQEDEDLPVFPSKTLDGIIGYLQKSSEQLFELGVTKEDFAKVLSGYVSHIKSAIFDEEGDEEPRIPDWDERLTHPLIVKYRQEGLLD